MKECEWVQSVWSTDTVDFLIRHKEVDGLILCRDSLGCLRVCWPLCWTCGPSLICPYRPSSPPQLSCSTNSDSSAPSSTPAVLLSLCSLSQFSLLLTYAANVCRGVRLLHGGDHQHQINCAASEPLSCIFSDTDPCPQAPWVFEANLCSKTARQHQLITMVML